MADNVADRLEYMRILETQVHNMRAWRGSLAALSEYLTSAIGDSAKETMITAALGYTKTEIGELLADIDAFYTDLATNYPLLFYEESA
jgi:hypothetical protein